MQKLGLRRQLTDQSGFCPGEKYEIRQKYEIRPTIYVSAVKPDVNAARQTLGASVGGLQFLFSHACNFHLFKGIFQLYLFVFCIL